ncbi:MAG: insulinase family protein [Candidatus Omnitrophota bacterium]|nr:MAG: insulinase family protein [Candidatus Omnitrophota bacterium]
MYKKYTLKNGLNVVTSYMPHMESVSIGLWIGVGGNYEEKRLSGMSHLIEHMLFKGTQSRTANMLKEAIEGVGGNFNGFTSEELTCYLVKLPAQYMELGLDILSDMVLYPKLDPAELEKEKYVICEEIKMYMDQPGHHVFDILARAMWPDHALGRPIEGYINTIKSFKRDDLTDFSNQYYQPANMSVVATGKIDRRKISGIARKIFSMPSTKKRFLAESTKRIHKGAHVRLFPKNTKQTHLAFGFHGINRFHKLRYALQLLNIILGGNMSSRLFERLRERKALCYEISSGIRSYKDAGAFIIHAGVDNNKLVEASEEIVNELKELKDNSVTPGELYRAKEYYRGQLLLALEDTSSRMLWLGDKIMLEGKAPAIREIFKNIEKIGIEDIKEIVKMIFNRRHLNFATIGPVSAGDKNKLRKVLIL